MRKIIFICAATGLILFLTSCPASRLIVTSLDSRQIPWELRYCISDIDLDTSFGIKNRDTSLLVYGKDGISYLAHYQFKDLYMNKVMGQLTYKKISNGQVRNSDIIYFRLGIVKWCCKPAHPQIHCADTREAAVDTTHKYGCTNWKVVVR